MRQILYTMALVAGLFIIAVVLDSIPLAHQIEDYFQVHRQAYLGIAIGMLVMGFVVFLGTMLLSTIRRGRRMSEDEAKQFYTSNEPGMHGVWKGRAAGISLNQTYTFVEIKEAARSGAWRSEPEWSRFFIVVVGAGLLFIGLFSLLFVIGPPTVKLIAVVVVAYVVGRTIWEFARA